MLRHTAGVSYGNRGDTPLHKLYSSRLQSADAQTGAQFLEALGKRKIAREFFDTRADRIAALRGAEGSHRR